MNDLNKFGAYCIKNKVNGKRYIGRTANSFRARWNDHKMELRKGIHKNRLLQGDWNKYGEENFEFKILGICSNLNECFLAEEHLIRRFKTLNEDFGYNLKSGGEKEHHAESSKKMSSESNLGKKHKINTSGYIGVYYEKRSQNWRVIINVGGKNKSFGQYSDKLHAAKIHDYESFKLYGRLDILNFPNDYINGLPKIPPLYPVELIRGSKAKYKGITKVKRGWQVQAKIYGKFKYVGTFKSEIEAAKAFDNTCWEAYHDLKKLNFPERYINQVS